MLKDHGYSLPAPNQAVEGTQHPDRNAQVEHITQALGTKSLQVSDPCEMLEAQGSDAATLISIRDGRMRSRPTGSECNVPADPITRP